MKTTILLAGLTTIFPLLAAIAQSAPPPAAPRACLEFGEIYNWNVINNRTMIVEDNLHRKFRVSLLGYCPNLTFKERIGFRSPGAMRLTCLSPGDSVIVNNMGAGFQRCPIKSVEAYTPATLKADEAAPAANHH